MTVMAVDLDYAGMITENLEYTRASTVVQDREFAKLGEKIVVDLEPYTESFIYSYPDIKKSDVVDAANEEGIPVNELEVYIGMILTDPVFDEYKAATRSLGFWDVVGCIAIGESMQAWSTAGSKAIIKSIAKKLPGNLQKDAFPTLVLLLP